MYSHLILEIPRGVSPSPLFRSFISCINESLHRACSHRRPWSELLDFASFSRPQSLSDATSRIRRNLSYFHINYLALLGGILAISLLSHPLSLASLLLLVSAWLFLYFFKPFDQPLNLFGRTLSNHETLTLLVGATVVVMFFTSVGSLIISATLAGGAIMGIHGAFRDPEDLFLDCQDQASSAGFFSVANGASIASASHNVVSIV